MNDPMDQRTNASIHQSIQAFAAQLWEELFAKHDVEYMTMSYTDAMKVTFANLDKVGKDTWYG